MARKRLFHEVDSFMALDKPLPNASLNAAVTELSPIKKGRNSSYFDGTMTDGTSKLRLVGFSSEQQKKLATLMDSGSPARLVNCEIKRARQGDSLEIIIKKFTEINKSSLQIKVPETEPTDVFVTLDQLTDIQDFQRITVSIKVVSVGESLKVTGGKSKQDIVVSDATDTSRLTLWEDLIGSLKNGESYELKNIVVRSFRERKYLSMGKQGSEIYPIDDIGDVIPYNPNIDEDPDKRELHNAVIIAVLSLDTYKACITCKARVEATEQNVGICSKCSTFQRIDRCSDQLSAKLILQEEQRSNNVTLSIFGALLIQIADTTKPNEVTQEALLTAPPIQVVTFNNNNIITAVTREATV